MARQGYGTAGLRHGTVTSAKSLHFISWALRAGGRALLTAPSGTARQALLEHPPTASWGRTSRYQLGGAGTQPARASAPSQPGSPQASCGSQKCKKELFWRCCFRRRRQLPPLPGLPCSAVPAVPRDGNKCSNFSRFSCRTQRNGNTLPLWGVCKCLVLGVAQQSHWVLSTSANLAYLFRRL